MHNIYLCLAGNYFKDKQNNYNFSQSKVFDIQLILLCMGNLKGTLHFVEVGCPV